jgi:GNAT superfamily N-acetyltransferase
MSITIRRAVPEDCPQLLELVKELAAYERAPGEVTVSLDHFIQSGFSQHPVWWAFVAEEEQGSQSNPGGLLGFALYYIRFSTWKGQRMYLEDILVTLPARGRGIGSMLMERLIQEARERQFSGITWQVLEWNETAINFYKKYETKFDSEWVNCFIPV